MSSPLDRVALLMTNPFPANNTRWLLHTISYCQPIFWLYGCTVQYSYSRVYRTNVVSCVSCFPSKCHLPAVQAGAVWWAGLAWENGLSRERRRGSTFVTNSHHGKSNPFKNPLIWQIHTWQWNACWTKHLISEIVNFIYLWYIHGNNNMLSFL